MRQFRVMSIAALLAAAGLVAGCETVEEKAQSHYETGLELVEKGDFDRALVELKTVFKLQGDNYDARMLYAKIKEDQGDFQEAYGHYLLVSEQYPGDFPARLSLSRLAVDLGAWDEAQRHALVAAELQPDNEELAPILISVRYSMAIRNSDQAAIEAQYALAQALLAEHPEETTIRQVVLDKLVRDQKPYEALESVSEALALDPLNSQFNQTKLSILAQLQDLEGIGAQLQVMVQRFPENREVRTALVRWYLANNDADGAERFVRDLVANAGDDTEPRIALVQFLNQIRGIDAAIAELDLLIDEGLDNDTFRLLRASLVFDKGERDQAISDLQTMIDGREPSDTTRKMETTLARMLDVTGQTDQSKQLVAKVLSEDGADVNALKLKAVWLINEDKVPDAVLALRTALDQNPRDSETITLLARAYERGGNRELMAESLALAYEASNAGASESLRYANYLLQNEKFLTAEEVLLKALRAAPGNVSLLRSLADTYLALNDLPRAEQVVNALRQVGTDETRTYANALEATILLRTSRTDESIQLLQSMVTDDSQGIGPQAAIIRTHLANGEIGNARLYMNELLSKAAAAGDDKNTNLMFLNAALLATEGDYAQAKTIYREILAVAPETEEVWRALIATTVRQGDKAEGEAIVDEALQELPDSANLLWIKAGLAEQNGRVDEAIAIYDRLYSTDSSSTIVANNLASLLANYGQDDESLQRAFVIARRLRGTTVPAFQDTYGWIAFRLTNYSDALQHLEPAATGLPDDPSVQYHLAKTYVALGRSAEAVPYFERAVTLWADTDLPAADDARAELARLGADGQTPAASE